GKLPAMLLATTAMSLLTLGQGSKAYNPMAPEGEDGEDGTKPSDNTYEFMPKNFPTYTIKK
ncbi:MAG: hypothetical protein KJ721_00295, partial [Nanoarchaeota archaeon]|nr:hypothetical protein [Nanoarchaeota archaeon]